MKVDKLLLELLDQVLQPKWQGGRGLRGEAAVFFASCRFEITNKRLRD